MVLLRAVCRYYTSLVSLHLERGFYDFSGIVDQRKNYDTENIFMYSLLYWLLCVLLGPEIVRSSCHSENICQVSLQCEFYDEPLKNQMLKKLYYKEGIYVVFLRHAFSCDFLGYLTEQIPSHIWSRNKSFRQGEFSYEFPKN